MRLWEACAGVVEQQTQLDEVKKSTRNCVKTKVTKMSVQFQSFQVQTDGQKDTKGTKDAFCGCFHEVIREDTVTVYWDEYYSQRNKLFVMFSSTTAQHIYCTNTVQTVEFTTELYLQ